MLGWCYQSFPNNNIWLPNGSGSLANRDVCYDTSIRMDQKRGHQWLMDVSEQELFVNKKQAVDSVKATSGPAVMGGSLRHDGSSSQSGCPAGDHPLYPKPVWSSNVCNMNNPSIISAAVDMEKKSFESQFGNESLICPTLSHAEEDPLWLNTRMRKVNKVRISENCLPEFLGNSLCPGEKDDVMSTAYVGTDRNMIPVPTYNISNGNAVSVDPTISKVDKNFISAGAASYMRDGSLMLPYQYYKGVDKYVPSIGEGFNRGNYSINTLGEQCGKESGNFMSVSHSKVHENFVSADPLYNRVNERFMPAGSAYSGEDRNLGICGQQNASVVSFGAFYNKENSGILSMVENFKKGEQTTISFGCIQDNHEERDHCGRLINSYNVLLNQSSAQSSGVLGRRETAERLSANGISAATSWTNGAQKNKDKAKKGSSNNFPSNVKSLLSTGILDGVPVKYVSWSREKNLRGVVKGTGYLCSCQDCKLSKVINAYEFERHAECKTKHPNNHIYFENGKTIYAVVQELKNTPQEMLFEVIQNATGSHVNQKNFSNWKASYQAATREIHRISGKDEMICHLDV